MSKYYILERFHTKDDIFIKEYNDPNEFDEHYIDGKKIEEGKEVSKYFYPYKTSSKTDILLGVFYVPIVSYPFKEILRSLEPHNLEFHPIELICQKTGEVDKSYSFLNILNHIACFNWELSDYRTAPSAPTVILEINKLVINNEAAKGRHIFRLEEFETIILISEQLKLLIEKENFTGLRIIGVEEYGKVKIE